MTTSAIAAAGVPDVDAPLWRNRDFQILWISQFVSTTGSDMTNLAIPLLVLHLTHSPTQAGIVGFVTLLPLFSFFPVAGVVADRYRRRSLMMGSDAIRAVALGSLVAAYAFGALTVVQIAVVGFVERALFTVFASAENAALPHIVEKHQLVTALARNQARDQAGTVIGQPLGGVLFGIGAAVPFAVDAVSYALSVVGLRFVRPKLEEGRAGVPATFRKDLAEGAKYALEDGFIRLTVLAATTGNFIFGGLPLVLIVRAQQLGASPSEIGLVSSMLGIGGIAGASVASRTVKRERLGLSILAPLWAWAFFFVLLPLSDNIWLLGVLCAGISFALVNYNVASRTYRYAVIPDALIGRVMSVTRFVSFGAIPLGSLAAGIVAGEFGAVRAFVMFAVVAVALSVVATSSATLRNARA